MTPSPTTPPTALNPPSSPSFYQTLSCSYSQSRELEEQQQQKKTRKRKKKEKNKEMGSASKTSLLVAASISAVEVLKDQAGLCRWNYALRSIHQRAKSNMGSFSQAQRMSSSLVGRRKEVDEQAKKAEESLRTVMYLSCWGPN